MNPNYNFKASIFIFCIFSALTQAANSRETFERLDFQKYSWVCKSGSSLDIHSHKGIESLLFRSRSNDGIALLENVFFREGTIEMDIASSGRSYPTIALFASSDGTRYDRLTINPLPFFGGERPRRLRQAVVSTGIDTDETSTVLNFHIGDSDKVDNNSWFHLRITIDDGLCSVYIDDDTAPMFVGGNLFQPDRGTKVGIAEADCFIRNVKVTAKLIPPTFDG